MVQGITISYFRTEIRRDVCYCAAVFKEYFEQFGPIEDVVVMYDQETKRPRGFGFITFESEEAVDRVFKIGDRHELQEKQVYNPQPHIPITLLSPLSSLISASLVLNAATEHSLVSPL